MGQRGGWAIVRGVAVPAEQPAVFRARVPASPYSLQVGGGDEFRVGMQAAEVAEKDECSADEQEDRADNNKALGTDQYGSICVRWQV